MMNSTAIIPREITMDAEVSLLMVLANTATSLMEFLIQNYHRLYRHCSALYV